MNFQKEVLSLYKVWTEGAKWEFGEKLVIERGQADGHVECGGGCSILEGWGKQNSMQTDRPTGG